MLENFKNKRILILGFGREGRDTFKFLRRLFPEKVLGIGDIKKEVRNSKFEIRNDKKIKWHLGNDYLQAIKNYEVVIKSPGIPPKVIAPFLTKKQKVTSQTEIFFDHCQGKIVGVTGTKGKSTTTALIYKILKEGELKVHLVGNIGKPVLNLLFSAKPNDIYVYELSSHQLYNLRKSPSIAVFLNIQPEHLDYYKNFNQYFRAKQNITRYQKKEDYFIYNAKDPWVKKAAKITKAKKIPISQPSRILKNIGILKTPLLGVHNLLNTAVAIKVAKIFKIPKEKIKKAIENFKPLPHRLEYVGNFKGIEFYNDSLATTPEATIAALNTLGNNVQTIFLGGFDRGRDFKNLVKRILKSKIKNLILFPTTGEKIWREILEQIGDISKLPEGFLVQNMKDGVKLAYQYTEKGKICLLSCASASFGLFKDYKERGNLFKKYLKLYGRGKN